MRLLWLADVLRQAGLKVHEYPGWQSRGSESWGPLRGIVCHATAGSRTSTDASETRVLWVTGSTSAPAPISQLYLSRSGEWWVGASGRCNHVLVGDKGPHKGRGNYQLIGIEAQNDNRGQPWPSAQVESYARGVAAICRRMGWPASVVVAHREHQSGKSDPLGIDMTAFRATVAQLVKGGSMADTPTDIAVGDILRLLEQGLRGRGRAETHGGGIPIAWIVRVIKEIQDKLDVLAGKSPAPPSAPGGGQVDPAVLRAAIREALSDPSVLSAVARAVADEQHRRMAE